MSKMGSRRGNGDYNETIWVSSKSWQKSYLLPLFCWLIKNQVKFIFSSPENFSPTWRWKKRLFDAELSAFLHLLSLNKLLVQRLNASILLFIISTSFPIQYNCEHFCAIQFYSQQFCDYWAQKNKHFFLNLAEISYNFF